MLESCWGVWKGLSCAHLMGKVTLETGLLIASGLAKSLYRALSRHSALWLGRPSCPLPPLISPAWEVLCYQADSGEAQPYC